MDEHQEANQSPQTSAEVQEAYQTNQGLHFDQETLSSKHEQPRLSRREVLFQTLKGYVVLVLSQFLPLKKVLASTAHSPTTESTQEPELIDCLILGGGISGMTAANALAYPRSLSRDVINKKPRAVLVLEGQGRLGGRTFTRYVKDFPGAVELGAQYVHVDNKKNRRGNPYSLWGAFNEYKIVTHAINRTKYGIAFSKYFAKVRRHWQMVLEFPLNWVLSFREEITKYRGPDMSIQRWLFFGPNGSLKNPTPEKQHYTRKQKPLVDIYLSGPASGRLKEMSLRGFNLDRFATMDEGNHEYKVIPGWSYFVEQLKFPLRFFPRNPFVGNQIPIKFNSEVVRVEYHRDYVEVTVHERRDGKPGPASEALPFKIKTYRARTAIATFPIGILRRAAGIDPRSPKDLLEFSPPLPEKKVSALKAIGVGVAAKMFIVFDQRFWDQSIALINRLDGLSQMGRTYFVPEFGSEQNNVVLGAYFGGAEAHQIVDWSPEVILAKVCDELAEIFPEANGERRIIDRVKRDERGERLVLYKHWALDRWSWCNDSYLAFNPRDPEIAKAMPTARRDLASAGLTGALHWAGEATVYEDGLDHIYNVSHAGVTHGAHTSGLRAAKEVAAYLDRHSRG
jgi:hypothetical protein